MVVQEIVVGAVSPVLAAEEFGAREGGRRGRHSGPGSERSGRPRSAKRILQECQQADGKHRPHHAPTDVLRSRAAHPAADRISEPPPLPRILSILQSCNPAMPNFQYNGLQWTPCRYPAARSVAPAPAGAFHPSRRLTPWGGDSRRPSSRTCDAIEAIVDAAFWASLRREEGYVPKISLALMPPAEAVHPLMLRAAAAARPRTSLVKVAPAVERPASTWASGATTGRLQGLGHDARRSRPSASCSRWPRPGCSSSSTPRRGGKFVNVAVLEGDQIKMIDERHRACPTVRRC